MNFQIKGVENENNKKITITGYSESLKSFFKVKLTEFSKNELNLDKEVNEANFNILIPCENAIWNIDTTLDGVPFNIENNINDEFLKRKFFPYKEFQIPAVVWQCFVGSVTTQL
tara:strand:+ start:721 stop:1062 length:342 start_codon:yes stop_codon:yes gene_type:complete